MPLKKSLFNKKKQQKLICVEDYEKLACRKLSKNTLSYYKSGADEETTLHDNIEGFKRLKILPRFMRDVSLIDTRVKIFDTILDFPICVSPSAMHKLTNKEGEMATAQGINENKTIMTLSTLSTTSIENIGYSYPNLNKWFQLYLFKEREKSAELVRRAEKAGYKAIVLTVDAPVFGLRRNDVRNDFKVSKGFLANFSQDKSQSIIDLDYIDASITWNDLKWLAELTHLPVLVKGILTPEDSILAVEHGAKGVIVSNHGGRQLDSAPATIDVLPQIARACEGRCPVFVDGGVRTGIDVFKCLALGATAVFIGRPILWGLTVNGADGVSSILQILKIELERTMRLSGCKNLDEVRDIQVIHQAKLWSQV